MTTTRHTTLHDVMRDIVATSDHDEARFARVVEAATPYLLQYVRLRVRLYPAVDAEDVVQDALVNAWRNWYVVEPKSLAGWLYRIIINCITDVHRRRVLERAKGHVPWTMVATDDDAFGRVPPLDPQDVEAEAMARVTFETLLADLEPADACLIDFGVHDMSYDDMAAKYGITRASVKSRLWRRRAVTRQRMEAWA